MAQLSNFDFHVENTPFTDMLSTEQLKVASPIAPQVVYKATSLNPSVSTECSQSMYNISSCKSTD